MKNLLKSLLFVVAAIFVSCTTTEEVVRGTTAEDAIAFGTFTDQATKGTVLYNETIQGTDETPGTGFGIMGYYNKTVLWENAYVMAPNLMYNQAVYYSQATAEWVYSPTKYWSNISGEYYTFFAYAPYQTSSNGIVLSSAEYEGVPTVGFTIQDEALDMVDFVAGQEIDALQQTAAVKFNLKHQLTRLKFSALTDIEDENTTVVVSSMNLQPATGFFNSGTYTFDSTTTTGYEDIEDYPEDDHTQDGVWSALALQTSAYPFTSLLAVDEYTCGDFEQESVVAIVNADAEEATSLFTAGEYLFLLPPNGQDGITEEKAVTFDITYQIVTYDEQLAGDYFATDYKTATITLPEGSLKQGRAYNIILTVNLEGIEVTVDILPWDEDEDYNINSNGEIIEEPSISLDAKSIALVVPYGEEVEMPTATIAATILEDLDAEDIVWSVEPEGVVAIVASDDNLSVTVTPVAAGTAVITATINGESVSCTVVVTEEEAPEPAILFDDELSTSLALKVGADNETGTFEVTLAEGCSLEDVAWSVVDIAPASDVNDSAAASDEAPASEYITYEVSEEDGVITVTVTGIAAGVAEITGTIDDESAVCVVTVAERDFKDLEKEDVTITVGDGSDSDVVVTDGGSIMIEKGETIGLYIDYPEDTDISSITLSSSDDDVVIFGMYGGEYYIKGVKAGTTTITVAIEDKSGNQYKFTFDVEVVDYSLFSVAFDAESVKFYMSDSPSSITSSASYNGVDMTVEALAKYGVAISYETVGELDYDGAGTEYTTAFTTTAVDGTLGAITVTPDEDGYCKEAQFNVILTVAETVVTDTYTVTVYPAIDAFYVSAVSYDDAMDKRTNKDQGIITLELDYIDGVSDEQEIYMVAAPAMSGLNAFTTVGSEDGARLSYNPTGDLLDSESNAIGRSFKAYRVADLYEGAFVYIKSTDNSIVSPYIYINEVEKIVNVPVTSLSVVADDLDNVEVPSLLVLGYGETLNVSALVSNEDATVASYQWTTYYSDDRAVTFSSSDSPSTTITASDATATDTIFCTVTDYEGNTKTVTIVVSVIEIGATVESAQYGSTTDTVYDFVYYQKWFDFTYDIKPSNYASYPLEVVMSYTEYSDSTKTTTLTTGTLVEDGTFSWEDGTFQAGITTVGVVEISVKITNTFTKTVYEGSYDVTVIAGSTIGGGGSGSSTTV